MKNYITPDGYTTISDRVKHLLNVERPEVVAVVSWAAANGDRSENGDYIYGKKLLRKIDNEIRRLTKSLESAVIVPPREDDTDQIFFGCFVTFLYEDTNIHNSIRIVGTDEIDVTKNYISWKSPLAKALLGKRMGDAVTVATPEGNRCIVIVKMSYSTLDAYSDCQQ
ncbi:MULTISPECIES: transcription elongation factor GreB [Candidatus Ichthyocystis]|uniref:Transcription elongation factor GreB n=1 Tax=Candidatus Ichthyocystis hellenicum TaxID=1561003 RepID=A0A0S4M708_9BURK|nr:MULTISPECIES: transcription elongation factor GreB [Ichthyocystis]CUT18045.1 Transcript elongation factor greB [Candidatus Ichthyocystis hellenicum]